MFLLFPWQQWKTWAGNRAKPHSVNNLVFYFRVKINPVWKVIRYSVNGTWTSREKSSESCQYNYTYSAHTPLGLFGQITSSITLTYILYYLHLKRQCQPQCICLHFTLKVMECQQITIINISLVLCRYNSVKMSKYNHRMVEIYDGLKTKTWITLPIKWPPSIVWARNAL
jgi:hypothetical protein